MLLVVILLLKRMEEIEWEWFGKVICMVWSAICVITMKLVSRCISVLMEQLFQTLNATEMSIPDYLLPVLVGVIQIFVIRFLLKCFLSYLPDAILLSFLLARSAYSLIQRIENWLFKEKKFFSKKKIGMDTMKMTHRFSFKLISRYSVLYMLGILDLAYIKRFRKNSRGYYCDRLFSGTLIGTDQTMSGFYPEIEYIKSFPLSIYRKKKFYFNVTIWNGFRPQFYFFTTGIVLVH